MIPGSANPLLLTSADSGYEIERSLRFNSGDSAYLNRTPSAASNRKTWTWSAWVKKSTIDEEGNLFSVGASSTEAKFRFNADNTLQVSDGGGGQLTTTAVFRDTSAWYHFVVVLDNTQVTAADRFKLYINGSEATVTGSPSAQNTDGDFNQAVAHYIGRQVHNTSNMFNGYLADVHFIDGQALAPTDFGKTDQFGVWQPKEFAGKYGWFDNSQTWSTVASITSGGAYSGRGLDRLFNGIVNNSDPPSTAFFEQANTGLVVTFSSAITATSSIKMWIASWSGYSTGELYVNGNNFDVSNVVGNNTAPVLVDLGVTSLTTFGVRGNQNIRFSGLVVDGKLLIDSGVSVADNSFHLDFADNSSNAALGTDTSGNNNTWTVNNLTAEDSNGRTYANAVTTTEGGGFYTGTGANLFSSGTLLYGGYNSSTTNSNIIWTPPNGIAVNNPKITLSYFTAVRINGTAYTPTGSGELTIPFVGTLNTLVLENTDGTGYVVRAYGLKPDGTNLVTIIDGVNCDSLVDTPTNGTQTDTGAGGEVVGNYATFNPLDAWSSMSFSNGNLQMTDSGNGGDRGGFLTISPTADKFYWEISFTAVAAENYIGLAKKGRTQSSSNIWSGGGDAYMYYSNGNKLGQGNGGGGQSYGASWTANDVIGVAVDWTNGSIIFYKNGASQGVAFSGQDLSEYMPAVYFNTNGSATVILNAGQRAFAYTAPSGYKALNTANLPEPTIADGSKYFDTKLYTGNGSTQTISGLNMSPDLVWLKSRNEADWHLLMDTVRGDTSALFSNSSQAQDTTNGTSQLITDFTSDGFTVVQDDTNYPGVSHNQNGSSLVSWVWDAGSSNTTIAAGSLNSSAYDQSQTWSSSTYFDDNGYGFYNSGGSAAQLFDNVESGAGSSGDYPLPTNGGTFKLTFTQFSSATTVSVKYEGSGNALKINGSFVTLPSTSGTATYSVSGLTTIEWLYNGSAYCYLGSVTVDGIKLVDPGVSVTDVPSIASTVRANPSAGFSIVSWSSASNAVTVGHGLNAAPKIYIVKSRDNTDNWVAVTTLLTNTTDYLYLNTRDPAANFGVAAPTSSTFIPSQSANSNYIAYCFAPVEGYSAMGSYVGNASASDAPFVYTGFKIRWLLIKGTTTDYREWVIYDTARDTYNVADKFLYAQSSAAEGSGYNNIDLLSNGFKPRGGDYTTNKSGETYIYLAFASNPFKTARAR